MGTGTHRTTGVRASKLGFASMRSSPALQGNRSNTCVQHDSKQQHILPLNPIEVPSRTMAATLESIEVVLMSHAGIQKSHNFITIQTSGLEAVSQWITVRACRW